MENQKVPGSELRIGNTPLLQVKNPSGGNLKLYAKLENRNPFGSIKDRAAYWETQPQKLHTSRT
jgi:cysteine synthase